MALSQRYSIRLDDKSNKAEKRYQIIVKDIQTLYQVLKENLQLERNSQQEQLQQIA